MEREQTGPMCPAIDGRISLSKRRPPRQVLSVKAQLENSIGTGGYD